ncbi:hypothetical protein BCR39DRAFT_532091 [Naematelia encephala]|uniref:Gamma-Tubulin ring complex non-core subunit mod21 N-terminal domain-containing protein n=1 Tax=Naematelia encephala TaxID=71784 RepID=A0A1Y2B3Z3_9TREE|nr:hypothetical protein BCR39DRAFT_532091 [Naematelia encephala]
MTSAELPDLAQQLVACLIPALAEDRQVRDLVAREVKADTHGGTRKEWEDVRGSLNGLARAARVRVQDDLAGALDKAVTKLEEHRKIGGSAWEGDMPIKMSNIPQHVQLLLNLAGRPTRSTHKFSSSYLERRTDTGPSAEQLLFREIMSEPFAGTHWEKGFDEEVKRGWTDSESSSGDSEEDEELVTPASKGSKVDFTAKRESDEINRREESDRRLAQARSELENLKLRAYWNVGGAQLHDSARDVQGWRELSTQLPSASLAARLEADSPAQPIQVISAEQLQRELLFALSGRPGVLFHFNAANECQVKHGHPQVRHYSTAALKGLLTSIQSRATEAAQLRVFINGSLGIDVDSSSSRRSQSTTISKTQQAFAEACREVHAGLRAVPPTDSFPPPTSAS